MGITNLSPAITNSSKEVLEIAGKQIGYHRTEDFSRLLIENENLLLELIGCKNGRAIFLTCSGTGAMDSVVCNLIGLENRVLIINGGSFGQRWWDICDFYNIKYYSFNPGFGRTINLEELENVFKIFKPTKLLMQHMETSSGQLHDVQSIGEICKSYDCDLIVDSISGFVNEEYKMDEWNISVTITSTQKGLALSPGLSMVILNEKMLKTKFSKRNYYLDFEKYLGPLNDVGLPFTPNIIALNQLNYRLKEIKSFGIQTEINKRKSIALDFRDKIKGLPFEIIAENPGNAVTGLYTSRCDVKNFFKELSKKKIFFSPSGGESGKKFVVGHMGEISFEDNDLLINEFSEWVKKEDKTFQAKEIRGKSGKIVFTSGTWDMFHQGHLNLLKKSKALGDKLIVAVSTDELVKSYKGSNPVIPFEQRVEIIRSCKYVDEVISQTNLTDIEDLKNYGVNIITIGDDWKDKHLEGLDWAKNNGIEVIYLPYTQETSTTQIIKKIIKEGYDIAFAHGQRGISKLF